MARFGFNSRRYEMLMSALLVYATRRTANCVALAILIGSYQLVNDYVPAEVMPASVFAALHSRAPGQSSTSGTECHTVLVGSRVQLQETVSASTESRGVSCLSSLCWTISLCGYLTARKRNSTKVSLCRRVFLKLNRHIPHKLSVLWTEV